MALYYPLEYKLQIERIFNLLFCKFLNLRELFSFGCVNFWFSFVLHLHVRTCVIILHVATTT